MMMKFNNKCKICGHNFYEEPLLSYRNMPASAQNFPDKDSLNFDKGEDFVIQQCSGCALVQLSNNLVPYYREVIRAAAYSPEMKEFRITQFKDFVSQYNLKNKKIIELGCGKGEYLTLMQETKANVYGIEFSKESVKVCVEKGLNVSQDYIDDTKKVLKNSPFDGFFILNFLEHVPDPNTFLSGIYNNLTDNGIGLIEVPNFDMILKKNLFSEFIPDHLFYFTKETLCSTLKLNGFDIIDCREIWYDYIISGVIKKRSRINLSRFYEHQRKLKREINEYIAKYQNKRVAIWGAGHQSLAIIAMTEIADKIKYVIDSATFKQGKYTPATHVPIVSPSILNTDIIDAIIIIAGGYSDEVARIVCEKFEKRINISILRDYGIEIIS